jgi:hypothetical protein
MEEMPGMAVATNRTTKRLSGRKKSSLHPTTRNKLRKYIQLWPTNTLHDTAVLLLKYRLFRMFFTKSSEKNTIKRESSPLYQVNFLICRVCFWCASYLYGCYKVAEKCPICNNSDSSSNIESIPISDEGRIWIWI